MKKAGHAGTLDPLATGMLPIAIGAATKTVPYIFDAIKTYEFDIEWGAQTDTHDAQGNIVFKTDNLPTKEDIIKNINNFIGYIEQTPPEFSAIKVNGVRAYHIARKGEPLFLKPRKVFVQDITLIEHHQKYTSFVMKSGKGVYVRAIARDLGKMLESAGFVSKLRRVQIGNFEKEHMIDIDDIEDKWQEYLKPTQYPLQHIKQIELEKMVIKKLQQGQTIKTENIEKSQIFKTNIENGYILILKHENDTMKMLKNIKL